MTPVINYAAVVVCAIVAIVLGSFWYSPLLFGKVWMKELGIGEAEMEAAKKKGMAGMWKSYALQIVASLVTAYIFGHFVNYSGSMGEALELAFWIWVGFFAATSIGSVIWENRSWKYWAVNNGFSLLSLGITAAILVSWK